MIPLRSENLCEGLAPSATRADEPTAYALIKRSLDVILAAAALVALAPLSIVVAAIVALDVGPSVIFRQQRIGRFGRPLSIYKFRTMHDDCDRSPCAINERQRISSWGYALRRSRLDEIPQLFNILSGEMSLIGPRPLLLAHQPHDARVRLQVRPGLTGLAQIAGGNLLTADERDALDALYIRQASLWLDLKILLRTSSVMITGDRRHERLISDALSRRQPVVATASGRAEAAAWN